LHYFSFKIQPRFDGIRIAKWLISEISFNFPKEIYILHKALSIKMDYHFFESARNTAKKS